MFPQLKAFLQAAARFPLPPVATWAKIVENEQRSSLPPDFDERHEQIAVCLEGQLGGSPEFYQVVNLLKLWEGNASSTDQYSLYLQVRIAYEMHVMKEMRANPGSIDFKELDREAARRADPQTLMHDHCCQGFTTSFLTGG